MQPVPIKPGPGQESVWDYPRPPRLEKVEGRVEIILGGVKVVDTEGAYRVLETSHPPGYYIPKSDILPGALTPAPGSSVCEFKGRATYWTLSGGDQSAPSSGWSYEQPTPEFEPIAGYVAFYAAPMDACLVNGVQVRPQPGGFYGGWITPEVVGPFKGGPGTMGW
jgi:uncharacterized protein (DUF427 family)